MKARRHEDMKICRHENKMFGDATKIVASVPEHDFQPDFLQIHECFFAVRLQSLIYPSALSHELHSISAIQGKETKAQKEEAEAGLQRRREKARQAIRFPQSAS